MTARVGVIRVMVVRELRREDVYGGAEVYSGTVISSGIHAHLDYYIPTTMLDSVAGIESTRRGTFTIKPPETDIRMEDKITIVFPPYHPDYNRVWRVIGVEKSALGPRDRRGFLTIGVVRVEESRTGKF